jgi:CubicO group peptidase (beta-lactamase class C family)
MSPRRREVITNHPYDVEALDSIRREHGAVGVVVGVGSQTHTRVVSCGSANLSTGWPLKPNALFQIGSITKPYTAVLTLLAVATGAADLDLTLGSMGTTRPLVSGEREFLRDVTLRQLLSHNAGLESDYGLAFGYADRFGRGDDCYDRFGDSLTDQLRLCPPGQLFSYSNAAYAIVGWLLGRFFETTWDALLQTKLLAPLNASDTVSLPEQALLRPVAVGHVFDSALGSHRLARHWFQTRASSAAGVLLSNVFDVLRFLRLLESNGVSEEGTIILPSTLLREMLSPQVEVGTNEIDSWGLGWALTSWAGTDIFCHSGSTIGYQSFACAIPDKGGTLAVLCNGSSTSMFVPAVVDWAAKTYLDLIPRAQPPAASLPAADAGRFLGQYECLYRLILIYLQGEQLMLHRHIADEMSAHWEHAPDSDYRLLRVGPDRLVAVSQSGETSELVFFGPPGKPANHVLFGDRVHFRC